MFLFDAAAIKEGHRMPPSIREWNNLYDSIHRCESKLITIRELLTQHPLVLRSLNEELRNVKSDFNSARFSNDLKRFQINSDIVSYLERHITEVLEREQKDRALSPTRAESPMISAPATINLNNVNLQSLHIKPNTNINELPESISRLVGNSCTFTFAARRNTDFESNTHTYRLYFNSNSGPFAVDVTYNSKDEAKRTNITKVEPVKLSPTDPTVREFPKYTITETDRPDFEFALADLRKELSTKWGRDVLDAVLAWSQQHKGNLTGFICSCPAGNEQVKEDLGLIVLSITSSLPPEVRSNVKVTDAQRGEIRQDLYFRTLRITSPLIFPVDLFAK